MNSRGNNEIGSFALPSLYHPDISLIMDIINETGDGRFAVSISGRRGRIIASVVQYKENGEYDRVEEFSCKTEDTQEELHSVLESIYKYITRERSQEADNE